MEVFGDFRILKAARFMGKDYIEQRNGGYFVQGTRVSLDSLIYAFLRGESPEEIANSFPALELEQIFGALAFYILVLLLVYFMIRKFVS
jgi:uncharacterized protein (DUF433 family)